MSEFSRRALFSLFAGLGVSAAFPVLSETPVPAAPAAEGHIAFPHGILLQWGRFDRSGKHKPWPARITFTKPFSAQPWMVSATFDQPVRRPAFMVVGPYSAAGVSLYGDGHRPPRTGYWIAFGPTGGSI